MLKPEGNIPGVTKPGSEALPVRATATATPFDGNKRKTHWAAQGEASRESAAGTAGSRILTKAGGIALPSQCRPAVLSDPPPCGNVGRCWQLQAWVPLCSVFTSSDQFWVSIERNADYFHCGHQGI